VKDLDADVNNITVIESLCMNCHKNGETRYVLAFWLYLQAQRSRNVLTANID